LRYTTDEIPSLDVRDLKRLGQIAPGQERVSVVVSRKRVLDPGEPRMVRLVTHLRLTWTPCNFGGSRPWFMCEGCGRRVAIVYGLWSFLVCRICLDLPYASQLRRVVPEY
jgi:hypothetical protein